MEAAEILALPDTVEVLVQGRRVARHPRLFIRNGKSELPGRREGLLSRSPRSKFQRIYELISGLGKDQADALFQIISKRTEVRTTIVTTNLIPSQ
jgi:hypothetical protein